MHRAHLHTPALQSRAAVPVLLVSLAACTALSCAGAVHASTAALTISGTAPGTVSAGHWYYFRPTVVDSHTGRTLHYSVSNKPSWASFSTRTGSLTA